MGNRCAGSAKELIMGWDLKEPDSGSESEPELE